MILVSFAPSRRGGGRTVVRPGGGRGSRRQGQQFLWISVRANYLPARRHPWSPPPGSAEASPTSPASGGGENSRNYEWLQLVYNDEGCALGWYVAPLRGSGLPPFLGTAPRCVFVEWIRWLLSIRRDASTGAIPVRQDALRDLKDLRDQKDRSKLKGRFVCR